MAASAGTAGGQEGSHVPCFAAGGNPSNGVNSGSVAENSDSVYALNHNSRLSVKWTEEEQLILDEGLAKYASEPILSQYATIAKLLQDKTTRDVVFRCRWMTKMESDKKRNEVHNLTRKNKDKKEKVAGPLAKLSSHTAAQPGVPPYALPMIPMDKNDGISYEAIGGETAQLLKQNALVFDQISANFTAYKIQENINLFYQTRDNILTILNDFNSMPDIMKQMPPLPVKVNEELANSIFLRPHSRCNHDPDTSLIMVSEP